MIAIQPSRSKVRWFDSPRLRLGFAVGLTAGSLAAAGTLQWALLGEPAAERESIALNMPVFSGRGASETQDRLVVLKDAGVGAVSVQLSSVGLVPGYGVKEASTRPALGDLLSPERSSPALLRSPQRQAAWARPEAAKQADFLPPATRHAQSLVRRVGPSLGGQSQSSAFASSQPRSDANSASPLRVEGPLHSALAAKPEGGRRQGASQGPGLPPRRASPAMPGTRAATQGFENQGRASLGRAGAARGEGAPVVASVAPWAIGASETREGAKPQGGGRSSAAPGNAAGEGGASEPDGGSASRGAPASAGVPQGRSVFRQAADVLATVMTSVSRVTEVVREIVSDTLSGPSGERPRTAPVVTQRQDSTGQQTPIDPAPQDPAEGENPPAPTPEGEPAPQDPPVGENPPAPTPGCEINSRECTEQELRTELRSLIAQVKVSFGAVNRGAGTIIAEVTLDATKVQTELTALSALTRQKSNEFRAIQHPDAKLAADRLNEGAVLLNASDGPIRNLEELITGLDRAKTCLQGETADQLFACVQGEVAPSLVSRPQLRRKEVSGIVRTLEQDPTAQRLRGYDEFNAYITSALAKAKLAGGILDRMLAARYLAGGEGDRIMDVAANQSRAQADQIEWIIRELGRRGAANDSVGINVLAKLADARKNLRMAEARFRETLTNPYPVPPLDQNHDVELAIEGIGGQLTAWRLLENTLNLVPAEAR